MDRTTLTWDVGESGMENANNKETINLLAWPTDTDTDSDISDLVLPLKRKKMKRRDRPGHVKMKQSTSCGCSKSDVRAISMWLAAVLIIFWLIALSWLAVFFYGEIRKMDMSIKSVIAGSEGVPDALQKCHSLSRDLQNNQTIIFSQLSDLRLQITNFTNQLTGIQRSLHQVQEWFQGAPALANMPTNLNALSSSVVSFGSKIEDLSETIKTLKATNVRVQDAQTTMQQNITSIKQTLNELTNTTRRPESMTTNETRIKTDELNAAIINLANNLTQADETLSKKIEWVIKDQKKDHNMLVSMNDAAQNISMRVISLEMQCAKKTSEQATILASVQKLLKQMNEIQQTDSEVAQKLKELEASYNSLRNSTNLIIAAIPELQAPKSKAKGVAESLNIDITTEKDHSGLAVADSSSKKPPADKANPSFPLN